MKREFWDSQLRMIKSKKLDLVSGDQCCRHSFRRQVLVRRVKGWSSFHRRFVRELVDIASELESVRH